MDRFGIALFVWLVPPMCLHAADAPAGRSVGQVFEECRKSGTPVVVWVGQPDRPDVPGCRNVNCNQYPGVPVPCVVVVLPTGQRVVMPGTPRGAEVWKTAFPPYRSEIVARPFAPAADAPRSGGLS